LLFIKIANEIIDHPFSVVYAHSSNSWLNKEPIIYQYFKLLPKKYKDNIQKIYILYPQMGVKMFFEFQRMFISQSFYNKIEFVENIIEFQKAILPIHLMLPVSLIKFEDEDRGFKPSGTVVPLVLDFDITLGISFLYGCHYYYYPYYSYYFCILIIIIIIIIIIIFFIITVFVIFYIYLCIYCLYFRGFIGTTNFMAKCISYLRLYGGLHRQGLTI
jgi:hypothetical protein